MVHISKTTTLHVHHITRFFTFLSASRRCTTTTRKMPSLISRFVEDVSTRQQLPFSFPDSVMQSFGIQLRQNLPKFDELNEMD